jgi:hypothetical protein
MGIIIAILDSRIKRLRVLCCSWWHTPIISALERWRQEDHEFEIRLALHSEFQANMGYIVTPVKKIIGLDETQNKPTD